MRVDSLIASIEELSLYRLSQPKIEWPRDFDVKRRAFDHRHAMTGALHELGFIRTHEALRVCPLKRGANYRISESLRRLRITNPPAIERALHAARLHLLDCVGSGERH